MKGTFFIIISAIIAFSVVQGFLWSNLGQSRGNCNRLEMSKAGKVLERSKEKYTGDRYGSRFDIATKYAGEESDAGYAPPIGQVKEKVNVDTSLLSSRLSLGDLVSAVVIDVSAEGALTTINGKMTGFLPADELVVPFGQSIFDVLSPGQALTVEVVGNRRGAMPIVSYRPGQLEDAWVVLQRIYEKQEAVEVLVVDVSEQGVTCDAMGVRAFIPTSQLLGMDNRGGPGGGAGPDPSLIGKTIAVKILELEEEDGKLVVSQRKLASDESRVELKRFSVIGATIVGMRGYGAFVELDGGGGGLLHISQMSYDKVESPEKLFSIGQRVKVMILELDSVTGNIALSTKYLERNPGDMLRDMAGVFETAEETAKLHAERVEAERLSRETMMNEHVELMKKSGVEGGEGGAAAGGAAGGGDQLINVIGTIEDILSQISEVKKN